jgi:hypothetical protein
MRGQKQRKGAAKTGQERLWPEGGEREKEQGSRVRAKRAVLVELVFWKKVCVFFFNENEAF